MPDVVTEFIRLVQIDSPSRNERALADYLRQRFQELGIMLTEDTAGQNINGTAGNLIGFLPGDAREPLLLCAHMDTVKSNQGIEVVTKDGKISSKNQEHILGADDKVGIAAIIQFVQDLVRRKLPHPPLELVFTVAEEIGILGAKELSITQLQSKAGYVLDSGGPIGTIVNQAPVHYEYTIKISGRAAHAGYAPEYGISAIQIGARIVTALDLGRVDEYTTANIGRISGGEADNIVPEFAQLTGEVRSHSLARAQQYLEQLRNTAVEVARDYGGVAEVRIKESFPPIQLPVEAKVIQVAQRAASKLGVEPQLVTSGGGSDANILNGRGISCANLGVGSYFEHTREEYIQTADFVLLVEYLKVIAEEW